MTLQTKNQRPTVRDVAAEANVSTSTVSLYLQGKPGVSDAMAERIASAIDKLDYVPRSNSRQKAATLITLLIETQPMLTSGDIIYSQVIQAIEAQARKFGHAMVFSMTETGELPQIVADQQVQGVLIAGGSEVNDSITEQCVRKGVPTVIIDNYIPGLEVDSVAPDNTWGGFAATEHLIQLGHRRIAIIEGPRKYKTLTDRLVGAVRAINQYEVPLPSEYRQTPLSGSGAQKGYREMQQLLALDTPPTAVFAVSDKTAFGAMEAIKHAGLRIPGDISIIGFDDVESCAHTFPPLTTIHVPSYRIGVQAMMRLQELIDGVDDHVPLRMNLYTKLVVRESTAPPTMENVRGG